MHFECGFEGVLLLVGVLLWRSEDDHQAVAEKFVERTLMAEYDFDHALEIFVEQLDDVFGAHGFAYGGEAADVAKHDRNLASSSVELWTGRRLEHGVHHLLGDIAGESGFDGVAFLKSPGHFVDRPGDGAEFIPRSNRGAS